MARKAHLDKTHHVLSEKNEDGVIAGVKFEKNFV
jgi:hypothetical protein